MEKPPHQADVGDCSLDDVGQNEDVARVLPRNGVGDFSLRETAASGDAAVSPMQRPGERKRHSVATGLQGLLGVPKRARRSGAPNFSTGSSLPSASATVGSGPINEAFNDFKKQLLFERAAQGESLSTFDALKQWKRLPDQEQERFRREAQQRRRTADAAALEDAHREEVSNASGAVLRALREQVANRQPAPRVAEAGAAPSSVSRRRKGDEKPLVEIPRPLFPRSSLSAEDRAGRRREIAGSVKARAEGASVSVPSSHGISLAEVSARLDAPTLSCDWQTAASDSDAEEPALEVDMPEHSAARQILGDDLRRRISAEQVRKLVTGGRGVDAVA